MTETVLIIAAHPDDEVLGCGGTMARHVAAGDVVYTIFAADGESSRIQAAKAHRNVEALQVSKLLGTQPPIFIDYADQRLDMVPLLELTQRIEGHIEQIRPTIVYTHHAGDLNEDHRIVHQAAMTACRPLPYSSVKSVYSFEVLSSTEWGSGFEPSHFVGIDFNRKVQALNQYHEEMRPPPHARSYPALQALATLRGASVGLNYAEAFMTLRSIVL